MLPHPSSHPLSGCVLHSATDQSMGRNIRLPLSQFGTPMMGRSSFLAPCGIVWGCCHSIAAQLLLCSFKEVNPQLIPFLQISIPKPVFWETQTTDKQFLNHKAQAIPSVPGHCRLSFVSSNFFIKWPFLTLLLDMYTCGVFILIFGKSNTVMLSLKIKKKKKNLQVKIPIKPGRFSTLSNLDYYDCNIHI